MIFPSRVSAIALHRPVLVSPHLCQHVTRLISRPASLSAIHRGIRHSERALDGESRFARSSSPRSPSPRSRSADRPRRDVSRSHSDEFTEKFGSRLVDGPTSWRNQQKLRKKLARKEAEHEDEEENGRKTRRRRFNDPDLEFGKKSLVYQLKYGALKDKVSQLPVKDFVRPKSFREKRRDTRLAFDKPVATMSQDIKETRPRAVEESNIADRPTPQHGRKKEMMNMTVKYTTAASQFLYGRSVVKAALEQGRRKLYNLYIYGGENRKDSKDNTIMTRLANKHGIPVTIVPNGEQRIMDKMSMGRPHNGFVLEASPLPQRPIKSLGRIEESPTRLGFHAELDFQTKEEEAINGTDTFIPRATDVSPKPFVLLLNEIVDPGNLGGVLRTASYLGVDAVGITNRGSSTLSPVVLKSAAGAVEEVTIFTVDDPLKFIEDSSKAGWKTYAAVAPPDRKLVRLHGDKFISTEAVETENPLKDHPCLLVLGNEGHGLSKPLKMAADYELSVPRFVSHSCVDSLNVSVAAGLLCHSFVKNCTTATEPRKMEPVSEPEKQLSGDSAESKQTPEREIETVF